MARLLSTTGLCKQFGRHVVLNDVKFEVAAGEIHGLLGANGAGKSTLSRIISGLTSATSGELSLKGQPFRPPHKRAAEEAGVDIVQQELNLVSTLSVAENLFLSRLPHQWGVLKSSQLYADAKRLLADYGLEEIDPSTPVSELGVGRQQMVEICRALGRECQLLILDEPTAALSGKEADHLFEHLERLRRQNVGIIYISHRLEEISRICDRITVLRDGAIVATESTASVSQQEMIDMMSGETSAAPSAVKGNAETTESQSARSPQVTPVLQVDRLSCGMVRNVTFQVSVGERFGITGLVGSGRTELLRAIFGADRAEAGSVTVGNQQAVVYQTPQQAVKAGLAMVTEDRKQNGLLLSQSIADNMTINSLSDAFSSWGVIGSVGVKSQSERIRRQLDLRCESIEQHVATLSGGNQQKVAVGRWLTKDAQVFLFDEPSRGIDAAARNRLYDLFGELAEQGKGMVIVSSDLEELLATCDRIAVMSNGRLVETFDRSVCSREMILQASFKGYSE